MELGEGKSAHSVDSEGKNPFDCVHELVLLEEVVGGSPSAALSSGVVMVGVAEAEVEAGPVMMESGGRMLKI